MRSRRHQAPALSPAVAELLAQSGELDRILDGRGLEFEPATGPAPEPAQPLVIPPPPWSQHYIDPEPENESEAEQE